MSEKEINDLKSQVGQCKAKLTEAEDRLYEALIRNHHFKVGDIVQDENAVVARVSSFEKRYGQVRPKFNKKTKSGWHAREFDCYAFTGKMTKISDEELAS